MDSEIPSDRNARRALAAYSGWSALVAAILVGRCALGLARGHGPTHEWIYLLCVALFHAIFAVWTARGRGLASFQAATVIGRLLTAAATLAVFCLSDIEGLPKRELFVYAVATIGVDVASAAWTAAVLPSPLGVLIGRAARSPMSFEARNRLVFALYMIAIGGWLLLGPGSLLALLRLPATGFAIPLVAAQVLVLAGYNLVAARHGLTPLIEAGIHGGSLTALGFLVLVATRLVHPIALVLPAVDLVSIALITAHRRRLRRGEVR